MICTAMPAAPERLLYFPPRSLPRSRYVFVGAMGIHELMPRVYIRHGGPDWPYYLLHHYFSPVVVRGPDRDTPSLNRTILWAPFADHYYGSLEGKWDHSWLNVYGSLVGEIVKEERIPLNTPLDISFSATFERYSRMLYDELHSRQHQDSVMIGGIIRLWFHELGLAARATKQSGIPGALTRARQYVESHYQERITLADLTRAAGLSPSQLSFLFQRHYGRPPMEYVINFRLKRAELLLSNGDFTISEIADSVGFSDPLYFSRQFKHRNGRSPSEYRKMSTTYPPAQTPDKLVKPNR